MATSARTGHATTIARGPARCVTVSPDQTRERLSNRIVRALGLARERAATADLLNFYADLCEFQQTLLHEMPSVIRDRRQHRFSEALDAAAAAARVPRFVQWLDGRPQQGLTAVSDAVREKSDHDWQPVLQQYWRHGG